MIRLLITIIILSALMAFATGGLDGLINFIHKGI